MSRKIYFEKTRLLDLIEAKQKSYCKFQEVFERKYYLVYYNLDRHLYTNVNSSIKTGISEMIYHVKDKVKINSKQYLPKKDVSPIMFLNRLLTLTEIRYWPIKLELASFI